MKVDSRAARRLVLDSGYTLVRQSTEFMLHFMNFSVKERGRRKLFGRLHTVFYVKVSLGSCVGTAAVVVLKPRSLGTRGWAPARISVQQCCIKPPGCSRVQCCKHGRVLTLWW